MSWDQSDDDDFDEDKNYFSGEDSDARRFMGNVTPTSSPGLNTSFGDTNIRSLLNPNENS